MASLYKIPVQLSTNCDGLCEVWEGVETVRVWCACGVCGDWEGVVCMETGRVWCVWRDCEGVVFVDQHGPQSCLQTIYTLQQYTIMHIRYWVNETTLTII